MNEGGTILYAAGAIGRNTAAAGGAVAAADEVLALCATGREVDVLCRERGAMPADGEALRAAAPRWLPWPDPVTLPFRVDRDALRRVAALRRAQRVIDALRPRLLVAQVGEGHRLLEQVRAWAGIPRIVTVNASPDQCTGRYHDGVDTLARVVAEMAVYDTIMCVSDRVAAKWRAQPALASRRFVRIPNCADEARVAAARAQDRAALRRRLDVPEEAFAVVCLASVQYRKGQDLLLDLLAARPADPRRLVVFLVGTVVHGWGGREILRRIAGAGLESCVRVLGHREDALDFLRAADLFVLPSREEAMPVSVLEAMRMGTPVLASDVDGIPELIEDGVSGRLFSHGDPAGFAAAFAALRDDAALRARFAAAAAERYEREFARARQVARWRALVEDLTHG